MAIHSIREDGGPPSGWKVELFAEIGSSEEFFLHLVEEMPRLVDATMIIEAEREKLREAILAISVEGLMPAFLDLKKIRALASQQLPILDRKQLFEDFTRVLWHAYKDLMQKAATIMEPEFGFLFQKDSQFEAGLAAWDKRRPGIARDMAPYLQKKRSDWQNELADFRNYLEHKDDRDPSVYAGRYSPQHAERLFDQVWRTIADILAMLISLHLLPGIGLVWIPPDKRNPVKPYRFGFHVDGLPPASP